jgi:hypothetical protein
MEISWQLNVSEGDRAQARVLINERASVIVAEIVVKRDLPISIRSDLKEFEPILAFKTFCLGWSLEFAGNVINPNTLEGGGTISYVQGSDIDFVYSLLLFLGINNSGLIKDENESDPLKCTDAAGNPMVLKHWNDYVKLLKDSGISMDFEDFDSLKKFAISFDFVKKSFSDLIINRNRNVVSF